MTSTFNRCLDRLIGVEKGYSDNRNDSGGKTRWGVTEALARQYGYLGDMREYPRKEAERVYWLHFWSALHLDVVASLAGEAVAYELFEQAVNMGRERPVRWLQSTLNALNQGGRLYEDISEDGMMGPQTLGALHNFIHHREPDGKHVLLVALNCLQGGFYIDLARSRPKDEAFLYGWLLQRVDLS